jgi:L-ribulose-5-phosphate 4-epimerase
VSETGSIKFTCEHAAVELAPFAGFEELNACRKILLERGWLGVDPSGIGFGNVSVRNGTSDQFYITGSGTGALPALSLKDYAKVTARDFASNWLRCEGSTVASSESLTHASIYRRDKNIGAVIHGHDAALWTGLRGHVPMTRQNVEYGTPQMAREVERLFAETEVRLRKLFVMGGHPAGFIVFGENLHVALHVLMAEILSR